MSGSGREMSGSGQEMSGSGREMSGSGQEMSGSGREMSGSGWDLSGCVGMHRVRGPYLNQTLITKIIFKSVHQHDKNKNVIL